LQKSINELTIRFKNIPTLEQHPPRIPSDMRTMGGFFFYGGNSCNLLNPKRLLMKQVDLLKEYLH